MDASHAEFRCLSGVTLRTPRERFLAAMFETLWQRYRQRVAYVQTYEQLVRQAGGTFVNDHIAFRTVASQLPFAGMFSLTRIFEALGYRAAGAYAFDDKHLAALHLQHAHPQFPKLFVSELQTWELPEEARRLLQESLASHRPALADEVLSELAALDAHPAAATEDLLAVVVDWFERLPWQPPEKSAVLAVNRVSQYGAWTMVHGYNVNHFTALVNSHGVAALDDLEKTLAALAAAGVPLKAEIEGARGSRLRQSATEAVPAEVAVTEGGQRSTMPWSYAYFELAQRDWLLDPATGQKVRFEGFLGAQATQLFEMTKTRASGQAP